MEKSQKTALTIFILIVVFIVVALKINGGGYFQGKIFNEEDSAEADIDEPLPDLSVTLSVIAPAVVGGDVTADVTVGNNGPGRIRGDRTFKYALYLDETEIFSNSDSYTFLEPGDSFNFQYPISREIYQYGDSGTIRAVVDTEDSISEITEENNSVERGFSL
ncbi:hypothetical protein HYW82_02970 [Candidatus Peregrinibacteria bacterium]|nr:hypothetical protein [Candidatus Peregrinibacteria bacterium]